MIRKAEFFDNQGEFDKADETDDKLADEIAEYFQIHNHESPKHNIEISDEEMQKALSRALFEHNLRKTLHDEQGQEDPLFDNEEPTDEQLQDIEGQRLIEGW